jgi:pimeloyl-ACP methyl ester carboxylesterase
LLQWCKRADISFLSSDYYGVGRSSGKFSDGSIGRWTKDTIHLIETILKPANKVILVGHGAGTWISFLVAIRRPDLVGGIVGSCHENACQIVKSKSKNYSAK